MGYTHTTLIHNAGGFSYFSLGVDQTPKVDVPTVSVIVPASVLKAQHYSLELDGLSPGGGAEVVGTYVFRMVRR